MKNSSPFDLACLAVIIVGITLVPPSGAKAGWISSRESQSWYNTTQFMHTHFWGAEHDARSIGGHLVAINNQAEQDFLVENYSGLYFIGLTDEATEGTFKWTNGDALNYQNWAPRQPDNAGNNEDYVVMNWNSGGAWNDLPPYWSQLWGIVEVANVGPTSYLASLGSVELGDSVTLDASASLDPNADFGDSITSYLWSVGGLSFTTSVPTLSLDTTLLGIGGAYAVELELTDTLGARGYASSQLIVSSSSSQATPEPSTLTLLGMGIVGLAASRWRKAPRHS